MPEQEDVCHRQILPLHRPSGNHERCHPPAAATWTAGKSHFSHAAGLSWSGSCQLCRVPVKSRVTYREHGHGGLVPRASDRIVSVRLGGSRCRDPATGGPSTRRVTAPGCHGRAGRAERRFSVWFEITLGRRCTGRRTPCSGRPRRKAYRFCDSRTLVDGSPNRSEHAGTTEARDPPAM